MKSKSILKLIVAGILFLQVGLAWSHGGWLVLQARSDLEPGVEFDRIRMTFTRGTEVPVEYSHVADPAIDYNAGARILEISGLPEGRYSINFEALLFGSVIASRRARYIIEEGHFHWGWGEHGGDFQGKGEVITVLLTTSQEEPTVEKIHPYKSATLAEDRDGSGAISPGDVVRYTIQFDAIHTVLRGSQFSDTLSPGITLIPGTVTSTHGVVFRGNFPNDEDILINFSPIFEGESVTITYDAVVDSLVRNQGELAVVTEGISYPIKTDDPNTQMLFDPTDVSLTCGTGQNSQCEADLGTCLVHLDEMINKVNTLEESLQQLTGDDDSDGVSNSRDDCSDTGAGDAVDSHGCSKQQFCGMWSEDEWKGWFACLAADWNNDASWLFPNDCRPSFRERRCLPR